MPVKFPQALLVSRAAFLTFAGVAGRSCTLPLEARGSVLDGFCKDSGKIFGTFSEYVDTFWSYLR